MFSLAILGACLVLVTTQNSPPEDVCSLNREVGKCRASIQAWYFDKASNECKTFNYSGCSGNANNFNSKEACDKRCATTTNPCNLKMERGACRQSLAAWYFDASAGQCKPFTYSGCRGNANNFSTQKMCESKCAPSTPKPAPKQSGK
ncbi:inter-alpha-trypsin inhibitor-like [Daphnia carinata]|uniref:inter-alpha-trypsin inhibitor-like n=1 Tax=Daphnia carinata TaxID=120202 RepID=UPI002868BEC8|nr:inter-alpha-trypsin inhibitor-like [Daphnia carinata]